MTLLEGWVGPSIHDEDAVDTPVEAEGMECSKRETWIIKPRSGYGAYRDMLIYYGVKNLLEYLETRPEATRETVTEELAGPRETEWKNLGGQLVTKGQLDALFGQIKSGELNDWPAIHAAYDALWSGYRLDKQRHAYATLCDVLGESGTLSADAWQDAMDDAIRIQRFICEQVYSTRAKDFNNPFRQATFESTEEQDAVVGTIEDNSFVVQTRSDTDAFIARCQDAISRA
jgi:hypothetical protein